MSLAWVSSVPYSEKDEHFVNILSAISKKQTLSEYQFSPKPYTVMAIRAMEEATYKKDMKSK